MSTSKAIKVTNVKLKIVNAGDVKDSIFSFNKLLESIKAK
jgi:hypothetical protein